MWPRCIALSDQNCFFAAIEQRDFPELRGKPVCVTNGLKGSTIITSSYEARAFGIRTGMRIQDARKLCPQLIQRSTRPAIYADVSTAIMEALALHVTDHIEIFSVDEAFLDLTASQHLLGSPEQMGKLIKRTVLDASGLLCSVGISSSKAIAKFAAKQKKPDGLTIIAAADIERTMRDVPVEKLSGINTGIKGFLNARGVYTCGEMKRMPVSVLAQRFGNVGRHLWLMAQGLDTDPVHTSIAAPKSLGHGKVLPPGTRDREKLLAYFQHLCEKVAARLRKHNMVATRFYFAWRFADDQFHTTCGCYPTNDGDVIYFLFRKTFDANWREQGIFSIQVTALEPYADVGQHDLFRVQEDNPVTTAIDAINQKFGKNTVRKARMLTEFETPDVISPAWKPGGHRDTIVR